MKNQLTIDQRIHNGIKKVTKCYSDVYLLCSTFVLISKRGKIQQTQDVDKINIEMYDRLTRKVNYRVFETPNEGEFGDVVVVHKKSPKFGYLFEWPFNHSLDNIVKSIIDKHGTIDDNIGVYVNPTDSANTNPEFDVMVTYSVSGVQFIVNIRDLWVCKYV